MAQYPSVSEVEAPQNSNKFSRRVKSQIMKRLDRWSTGRGCALGVKYAPGRNANDLLYVRTNYVYPAIPKNEYP